MKSPTPLLPPPVNSRPALADAPLTRLVLARVIDGGRLRAHDLNYQVLLARAQRDGFFPILYRYLCDQGAPIPPWAQVEWRTHLARLALIRAEIRRVLALIEPLSPVIVLKGGALSMQLWGDATLRNTTDLDLLIDPAGLEEIVDVLVQYGYDTGGVASTKPWAYNQLLLQHRRWGTLIELHWRVAFPHLRSPAVGEMIAHAHEIRSFIDGIRVKTLAPEYLLLQLCYHFQQHHGFFKGLLDIAGWIDRYEAHANLEKIIQIAREQKIVGVLQWPLHTLAQWIGVQSRLYNPGASLFARAGAAWSVAQFEREYVDQLAHTSIREWLDSPGFGPRVVGTLTDSLALSMADGRLNKGRAMLSVLLLGPHRLGRGVFGCLERLRLVDRKTLFEDRILG